MSDSTGSPHMQDSEERNIQYTHQEQLLPPPGQLCTHLPQNACLSAAAFLITILGVALPDTFIRIPLPTATLPCSCKRPLNRSCPGSLTVWQRVHVRACGLAQTSKAGCLCGWLRQPPPAEKGSMTAHYPSEICMACE